MEVILNSFFSKDKELSILHVCGGDPNPKVKANNSLQVFSTYVEVILVEKPEEQKNDCILHVCGGDPQISGGRIVCIWYSPRMWR